MVRRSTRSEQRTGLPNRDSLSRISHGLGNILVFFSFSFIVPFLASFVVDRGTGTTRARPITLPVLDVEMLVPETALVFFLAGTLTGTAALTFLYFGRGSRDLRAREAYVIVGVSWLLVAAFGGIPYMALGALTNPIDAFFESMSGFTTTGATVLPNSLSTYPPSLLLWRAFEQWVGGMGIIVLGIVVIHNLTHGGHQLMSAETPGIKMERLRPKIAQTAKLLWSIYLVYTFVLIGVLWVLIHFTGRGVPVWPALYEATLHTFTTMATGGFSNHDESIAWFQSAWVDVAITLSMFFAGISFTLHYALFHERSGRRMWQDPETRFYALVSILTSLFVAGVLIWKADGAVLDSLRIGFLQTVAIITTTGFTAAYFEGWPDAARLVLLFMFFMGGCAGSTTGGLKIVRILVLLKLVKREMRKLLHPRAVIPLRLGKSVLNDDTVKTVSVFFFTYVSIFILGTILLTLMDLGMIEAISASASAIGNIGPALGTVHASYADVPAAGKLLLSLMMWFGRLEIFTTLILFSPQTWRR